MRAAPAVSGLARGEVQRALRRILTGRERGVGLRYVVAAVPREDALARADRHLERMNLSLYDSLSRTVRPVDPVEPGRFLMYTCGPTVYSLIHVGNARPFVVALSLRRHLRRQGIDARVVCNITDINEKIDEPARARGITSTEHARELGAAYIEDTSRLGLGRPDAEPLVTESIPAIVAMIERLVERGLAYAAHGDVYYRVRAFAGYGGLSGQRVDDLLAEGRVEAGAGKESPARLRALEGAQARRAVVGHADRPRGGRAGTSSAPRWPVRRSATRSTFTAAGVT